LHSPKDDNADLTLSPDLVQLLILLGGLSSGLQVILLVGTKTLSHGTLIGPLLRFNVSRRTHLEEDVRSGHPVGEGDGLSKHGNIDVRGSHFVRYSFFWWCMGGMI
jgi:hypothetical protein